MLRNTETSEEKQLWGDFRNGDDAALEKIYRQYFTSLYSYGYGICNDATLTEDAIQNLFLKLMRNRQNLALPDSVKGYLFTSLRSILFDEMDKQNRLRNRETLHDDMPFDMGVVHDPLLQRQEEEVKQDKVKKALEALTPRQREAVYLRYHEALSYPDVAGALQVSQKSAYKIIARAIAVLRDAAAALSLLMLMGFWPQAEELFCPWQEFVENNLKETGVNWRAKPSILVEGPTLFHNQPEQLPIIAIPRRNG